MKLRIGTKLMVVGAAILVVPFALMSAIVSMRAQSGITAIVESQLGGITQSMADYAEASIVGDRRAALALASAGDIAEAVGLAASGTPAMAAA